MRFRLSYAVVMALGLGGAMGCGLLSKDILKTSFNLPAKTFSVDTAAWKLPPGDFPAVPCGDGQPVADCCDPPDPLPKVDCNATQLSCDNALCTLHQPISIPQTMDLKKEVPALSSFSNQSVIDVEITRILYKYGSTMNIDMPPVTIYIAPDGVTDPNDPEAKQFGTTKVIHAGAGGEDTVVLTANAGALFADKAHHFGTPFNFIVATTVVIPSGSPVPSGRVTITVQGTATAGL